ncbi:MAG: hypothetical protein ACI4V1_07060 [Eubacteriales bacterium]
MTSYEFYRDTYGGCAEEKAFADGVGAAETVLRALLYPADAAELSGVRRDAFERAVCCQVDYRLAADAAGRAGDARVKSESLGDRSVTYEYAGGGVRVLGNAVAPEALLLLWESGCLSRWV